MIPVTRGHEVRPRVVFIWRLGYKGLDLSQSGVQCAANINSDPGLFISGPGSGENHK